MTNGERIARVEIKLAEVRNELKWVKWVVLGTFTTSFLNTLIIMFRGS